MVFNVSCLLCFCCWQCFINWFSYICLTFTDPSGNCISRNYSTTKTHCSKGWVERWDCKWSLTFPKDLCFVLQGSYITQHHPPPLSTIFFFWALIEHTNSSTILSINFNDNKCYCGNCSSDIDIVFYCEYNVSYIEKVTIIMYDALLHGMGKSIKPKHWEAATKSLWPSQLLLGWSLFSELQCHILR